MILGGGFSYKRVTPVGGGHQECCRVGGQDQEEVQMALVPALIIEGFVRLGPDRPPKTYLGKWNLAR